MLYKKKCEQCGKEFKAYRGKDQAPPRFCSRECYLENHSVEKKTFKCPVCNKEFKDWEQKDRKYCSRECADKAKSEKMQGNNFGFEEGHTPWNKGKKGYTNDGSFEKGHEPLYSGEEHWSWKGGISKQDDYVNQRRRNNPKIRLNDNMSNTIYRAIKDNKSGRHWEDLVDYTVEELMEHLENQFEDWMTWENWGRIDDEGKTWQIDHIKPRSSFDYNSAEDEEFKKCWALDNLQPLEAHKNSRKGDTWQRCLD